MSTTTMFSRSLLLFSALAVLTHSLVSAGPVFPRGPDSDTHGSTVMGRDLMGTNSEQRHKLPQEESEDSSSKEIDFNLNPDALQDLSLEADSYDGKDRRLDSQRDFSPKGSSESRLAVDAASRHKRQITSTTSYPINVIDPENKPCRHPCEVRDSQGYCRMNMVCFYQLYMG